MNETETETFFSLTCFRLSRPYAGVGFLQDLAVVRQSALSSIGVVGSRRSSTSLLLEWMEYDRLVDVYEQNNETVDESLLAELPTCILPR